MSLFLCLGQIKYSEAFSTVVTTTTPVSANVSNELIKSRMENGRYINSFNLQYGFPSIGRAIMWKITSRSNSRLPSNRKELDNILPIIRHEKLENLYLNTSGIRYIWIGHASSFIQMNNFRFLVDPIFR